MGERRKIAPWELLPTSKPVARTVSCPKVAAWSEGQALETYGLTWKAARAMSLAWERWAKIVLPRKRHRHPFCKVQEIGLGKVFLLYFYAGHAHFARRGCPFWGRFLAVLHLLTLRHDTCFHPAQRFCRDREAI